MPADQVEDLLINMYNVPPEAARAMAQDVAATYQGQQPMGPMSESGGVSRQSMYSGIQDAVRNPTVPLPQEYQGQLDYFAEDSRAAHQQNMEQKLMEARAAMRDTTNMALNRGRTPSQVMQEPYRAQAAGEIVQGAFGQPDRGRSFDAAGNARMQQTPQRPTVSPPMPAGNVAPGGPDFNDKYARYRSMMMQQDPANGEAQFAQKLEQRRQLLMQELQAIEQHRNGGAAAMAGASNAMKAGNELRQQSEYLASPLAGVSPRSAYDAAVQANNKEGY